MNVPERLGDLRVDEFLADPARKQAFVTPMFDRIAPRYDAFTRMFSFGMDAGWKRDVIDAVLDAAPGAERALDLACGTGDLAVALANRMPAVSVSGLDASPRMIVAAEQRLATQRGSTGTASPRSASPQRVRFSVGDMMSLSVADASVDVVTAGYGVRNVPDARIAVKEIARVLKPGGVFVALDFYRPENSLWRRALLAYLSVAGNAVGWWWHRDPVVYGYIAHSIEHFISWQAFSALLTNEGFEVQRVVRHLGGGIAMHIAVRAG